MTRRACAKKVALRLQTEPWRGRSRRRKPRTKYQNDRYPGRSGCLEEWWPKSCVRTSSKARSGRSRQPPWCPGTSACHRFPPRTLRLVMHNSKWRHLETRRCNTWGLSVVGEVGHQECLRVHDDHWVRADAMDARQEFQLLGFGGIKAFGYPDIAKVHLWWNNQDRAIVPEPWRGGDCRFWEMSLIHLRIFICKKCLRFNDQIYLNYDFYFQYCCPYIFIYIFFALLVRVFR